jgi:predicted transcriptional regulator
MASKAKVETTRVSVTLAKDDRDLLERLAKQRDRSLSWIAGRAITLFLVQARKTEGSVPGLEPPAGER